MSIMNQKLVKDFFEAVEVEKALTKKQIDIELGVPILKELIQDVLNDINTKDQTAKGTLDMKIKELDDANVARKENIKNKIGETDNSIDERNLQRRLLLEDHKKFKQELVIIQDLCFKKGWFD